MIRGYFYTLAFGTRHIISADSFKTVNAAVKTAKLDYEREKGNTSGLNLLTLTPTITIFDEDGRIVTKYEMYGERWLKRQTAAEVSAWKDFRKATP